MTARVLRESFTRNGSRRRSLFISAIVALWMATSLPAAPIAMPMSPAASAGRVVHAVAHHRHPVALGLDGAHELHLVLRQALALGFLAADLRAPRAWPPAGGRRRPSRCAARRWPSVPPAIRAPRRGSGPASPPSRCTGRRAPRRSGSSLRSRSGPPTSGNPPSRRCPCSHWARPTSTLAPPTSAFTPRPAVSAKSFGSASGTPASPANWASALAVG